MGMAILEMLIQHTNLDAENTGTDTNDNSFHTRNMKMDAFGDFKILVIAEISAKSFDTRLQLRKAFPLL